LQPTGTPTKGAVGSASARIALPTGALESYFAARIASTTNCYIKFGDGSVNAANTDTLFPAGAEVMMVPGGATHLAFIRDTADGSITITAMVP
jgi:hypothetical protein